MHPIVQREFLIDRDAFQKERIEDRIVFGGKLGKDRIESAHIVRTEVARRKHAAKQDRDTARFQPLQDIVQRRADDIRIDAAQGIVGAELENHRLSAFGHRPIEARQPARGGIAGDAGIRDGDLEPLGFERLFELRGKGLIYRQPKTGAERIAERHDPDGTSVTERSTHAHVTSAANVSLWTRARGDLYERGGKSGRSERSHFMHGISVSDPAIALAQVNLSLGRGAARVHILKDINLEIARGEAIGLVGPSGSGKSTLLMVMAGLERADTGAIVVAGTDLTHLDEDALARFRGRQVGIVFQAFHLIPTMTALENVAVPLELAGAADAQARAERELAEVGLSERLHHYPAQLSGGEQQRVALARALAPNPSILVADEPTGNLDEATGAQIIDLLFAGHAERETTLVLVTHDPALAARCDRVVRMRSGRVDGAAQSEAARA